MAKATQKRGKKRHITRLIVMLVCVVAVIAIAVMVLFPGLWFPAKQFKTLIHDKLSQALKRDVSVGDVETEFRNFQFVTSIRSIIVRDKSPNADLTHIRKMSARVDIMPLVIGKLNVTIVIDDPVVTITRDATGKLNIDDLLSPQKKPSETDHAAGVKQQKKPSVPKEDILDKLGRALAEAMSSKIFGFTPNRITMSIENARLRYEDHYVSKEFIEYNYDIVHFQTTFASNGGQAYATYILDSNLSRDIRGVGTVSCVGSATINLADEVNSSRMTSKGTLHLRDLDLSFLDDFSQSNDSVRGLRGNLSADVDFTSTGDTFSAACSSTLKDFYCTISDAESAKGNTSTVELAGDAAVNILANKEALYVNLTKLSVDKGRFSNAKDGKSLNFDNASIKMEMASSPDFKNMRFSNGRVNADSLGGSVSFNGTLDERTSSYPKISFVIDSDVDLNTLAKTIRTFNPDALEDVTLAGQAETHLQIDFDGGVSTIASTIDFADNELSIGDFRKAKGMPFSISSDVVIGDDIDLKDAKIDLDNTSMWITGNVDKEFKRGEVKLNIRDFNGLEIKKYFPHLDSELATAFHKMGDKGASASSPEQGGLTQYTPRLGNPVLAGGISSKVAFAYDEKNKTYAFDSFEVSMRDFSVSSNDTVHYDGKFRGRIWQKGAEEVNFDLNANVSGTLEDIMDNLPSDAQEKLKELKASGSSELLLSLKGTLQEYAVSGEADMTKAAIQYGDFFYKKENVTGKTFFNVNKDKDVTDVNQVRVLFDKAVVDVSGIIDNTSDEAHFSLRVEDFDNLHLKDYLPGIIEKDADVVLSGGLDVRMDVQEISKNNFDNASTKISLTDLSVSDTTDKDFYCNVYGNLAYSKDAIQVNNFNVKTKNNQIDIKIDAAALQSDAPQIAAVIHVVDGDVEAMYDLVKKFEDKITLPEQPKKPEVVEVKGEEKKAAKYLGLSDKALVKLQNADVTCDVYVQKLRSSISVEPINSDSKEDVEEDNTTIPEKITVDSTITDTSITISMHNGVLSVERFDGTIFDGNFSFKGSLVNFNTIPFVYKIKLDLEDFKRNEVVEGFFKSLFPQAAFAGRLSGNFNLNGIIVAERDEFSKGMSGLGMIAVTNGYVKGEVLPSYISDVIPLFKDTTYEFLSLKMNFEMLEGDSYTTISFEANKSIDIIISGKSMRDGYFEYTLEIDLGKGIFYEEEGEPLVGKLRLLIYTLRGRQVDGKVVESEVLPVSPIDFSAHLFRKGFEGIGKRIFGD